jgi:uracil-DNA glycosylase family 4
VVADSSQQAAHDSDVAVCDISALSYLEEMGIDVWVRRSVMLYDSRTRESGTLAESSLERAESATKPVSKERVDEVATLGWEDLRQRVAGCTLCELHHMRTQTVFGVGDYNAQWLFIGEAPGSDEDRQGEPFVGRAGQLLNNMIRAIGLSREKVFIANILKCRPPKNRDPLPHESQACRPYLRRQIELLSPKIIVALGRIAAQNLLQTDTPIGKMRGRRYFYETSHIPVVVTYHPAYLLRSPQEKRKAWYDLQLAAELASSG